jgi:hypothetical protein
VTFEPIGAAATAAKASRRLGVGTFNSRTKRFVDKHYLPNRLLQWHVFIMGQYNQLQLEAYLSNAIFNFLSLLDTPKTTAMTNSATVLLSLALLTSSGDPQDNTSVSISEAKKDANGFLVHEVKSPYQAGVTHLRVLLPEKQEPAKRYPVIYVLPVEAGNENRFGNGLLEIKKQNLHNKFAAIHVAPTFSHLPWYCDHNTKKEIRQETYFLKVVLPLIEKTYQVQPGTSGRLLLGFSKSGWGAFSLLLRQPELFGKAAAWDAPLMMDRPDRYGMGDIFGTQENFEKYQISRLLETQAGKFQKEKRLFLLGYGNFRDHHDRAHALMDKLKIVHEYRDGPARKHDWHSGWMTEAVEWLVAGTEDGGKR